MRHALVTGGGTAGHVVPAIPVIERLLEQGWRVTFVGSGAAIERTLIEPLGIPFETMRTGKLRRYFTLENVRDAFRVPLGLLDALRLMARLRPDVVFSKGGYVSFPVAAAAWLRRVPVVAHESDLTPGLANRLALPFISALCVNFAATQVRRPRLRVVHSGTPLRPALIEGDGARAKADAGFAEDKPWLVVVGGSLGAEKINAVLRAALDSLLPDFNVFHVCGAGKTDADLATRSGYRQAEFVGDGWGDVLAAASCVVSRAGANALYELLALRIPNVLIPLPLASSRGDQIENAEYAAAEGYSLVVPEEKLTVESLVESIAAVVDQRAAWRERLAGFSVPDSVAVIVAELERAAKRPSGSR